MESVLFVIPPYFNIDDYIDNSRSRVLPPFTIPYGVLSLEAYIRGKCTKQVEVHILDLNISLLEAIKKKSSSENCSDEFRYLLTKRIREVNPTLIGISALFNISFHYIEDIARTAKKESCQSLIVAGGGLPSAAYKQILEYCPSVDAVCMGEGEIPLVDLIDAENKADVLSEHSSWITLASAVAGKVPVHRFVQELDQIPIFNYKIINLDDYNSRSIDKRFSEQKKREMAIHTSRGCPFTCVFCSNPFIHGNTVRAMSVERVAEEVHQMKLQHGLTVLLIEDDHFFFDPSRAKMILQKLSELEIRVEFPNGVAVYAIDEEVACLLAKAGASTVALAVESGSDHVLKNIIGKPLKVAMIKDKVEILRRYGVQCHVFIVIGLPGEMPEHRDETLRMLLDVGFDWAHIFCAVPIFGSRLYDICLQNGYIKEASVLDYITTKSVITAPGIDPIEIEKTAYDFNLSVNFVNNYNLRTGNYSTAIKYFENVANKYPDHAFGHYFLAKAFEGIEDYEGSAEHNRLFQEIIVRDPYWHNYSEQYGLIGVSP